MEDVGSVGADSDIGGCTPFQYAITQIPYALIAAFISIIGYVLLAYS
jgi:Na+/H+ antiporter NhaC